MIKVKNLNKWYGNNHVLRDLNLEVQRGEIFGLLGPNGAGKSTLIKVLTGQTPAQGFVRVLGVNPLKNPVKVRKMVGIVPEAESVPNYLTVEEYLYFVAKVRRVSRNRVGDIASLFSLESEKDKVCRDLSKGTKQRLMLSVAMLHNPTLLFLDEPFINLDPLYQRRVRKIIEKYVNKGNTVFMATHILEIAQRMCTRIGIIKNGKIVKVVENLEDLEEIFLREFEDAQVLST